MSRSYRLATVDAPSAEGAPDGARRRVPGSRGADGRGGYGSGRLGSVLRRWWWIPFVTATAMVGLAIVWSQSRPDVYEAYGSYVLRAEAESTADLVRASASLARSDGLINTYAAVATSELVEDAARESVRAVGLDPTHASAAGKPIAGANVLLIGARSQDPETALAMARAVGTETQDYLRDLGDAFRLEPIDAPTRPTRPAGSGVVSAVLGSMLVGVLAGIGLASAADHRFPDRRGRMRHIIDPDSTVFTKRYLAARLAHELERAGTSGSTFSVGVLRVVRPASLDPQVLESAELRAAELTAVATHIRSTLSPKDVLAHLGQGRFAALLPFTSLEDARGLTDRWRQLATIELVSSRHGSPLIVLTGACEFDDLVCIGDQDSELIISELSR